MKKILLSIIFILASAAVLSGRQAAQTVTFDTFLHCSNCVKKVVENISFLKGVKDLDVSLEKQQIKIVFDPSRTSVDELARQVRKLGYKAEVHQDRKENDYGAENSADSGPRRL